MNDRAIEIYGLRKQFGSKLAVSDLTLTVRCGEVFGFLGPNGAGKTTSIKMLLGLIAPSGGTGEILGRPIGDRAARAEIGFLPEEFRFHDFLSGFEFLQLHGHLHGLKGARLDARIRMLLAAVDLEDAAQCPLQTYSKGMVQRIGLAQALINEPRLLILDEPTSGLDPLGRRLVRGLIRDCRAKGMAVFINSHFLSEIELICDRVGFIKNGRLIHEAALSGEGSSVEIEMRTSPLEQLYIEIMAG